MGSLFTLGIMLPRRHTVQWKKEVKCMPQENDTTLNERTKLVGQKSSKCKQATVGQIIATLKV